VKLLRVHIIAADTCGGLLDGLDISLRGTSTDVGAFEPLCLIGPNGTGKSQFLQIVAEIFQSIFCATASMEERKEANPLLQFEIEYLIQPDAASQPVHVRVTRRADSRRKPTLQISKNISGIWVNCPLGTPETIALLPPKVVGYTSGDNETLSLPFLLSRAGYAEEVGSRALKADYAEGTVPDTRLMLIDYGTHLEVLVANLLLGSDEVRRDLLRDARLDDLHSFRCIIQLAHSAAPKAPASSRSRSVRKGIQLTAELEGYLDNLKRSSTCYQHNSRSDSYTFDFFVSEETRLAFASFWKNALELYSALHKLAMLNDLAISKTTRERSKKDAQVRRFASRLPEPQDDDKVFRFERVSFRAQGAGRSVVDYVSLSDGEHQLAQLLGTLSMLSSRGVLFLLDEPESHFNPQWRVNFSSRLRELPTANGARNAPNSEAAAQECLLTTHAPFVASDTPRNRVLLFRKDVPTEKILVTRPEIETYGTTFDAILEECFSVRPPISQMPRDDINALMKSNDPEEIAQGIQRLGQSVEKVFLKDHLRQIQSKEGD
jgi:restriction system-associated AAA family ATPase